MNASGISNGSDYFQELFESRPSKVIFMAVSMFLMLLSLVLSYSIIWYEHYGLDIKRTILNRLSSLQWWTSIEFILFITLPEWIRFISGPLPEFPCWFHSLIKNALMAKLLFLQTGLVISRYACIFWLKNPAAFNDEYWSHFINVWVNIFSFWPHFVFVYLPGREPIGYYICFGKDPAEDYELPTKFNTTHFVIGLTCLAVHIVVSLRIFWYKYKIKKGVNEEALNQKSIILKTFEKHSLADFTTLTSSFMLLLGFILIFFKFSKTEPQDFNHFPCYLLVYWIQLINAPATIMILLALSYIKNKAMRTTMIRETKDYLRQFF